MVIASSNNKFLGTFALKSQAICYINQKNVSTEPKKCFRGLIM